METCANCGRVIGNLEVPLVWDGNVVCFACEGVLRSANAVAHIAQVEPAPPANDYACPRCKSPDTASLATIHASGATLVNVSGVGFGDQGVEVFDGGGTAHTIASMAAAPPRRRSITGIPIAAVAALGAAWAGNVGMADSQSPFTKLQGEATNYFLATVALSLVAVVSLIVGIVGVRWNVCVFPRLAQSWERCWGCRRCGRRFIPGEARRHREIY